MRCAIAGVGQGANKNEGFINRSLLRYEGWAVFLLLVGIVRLFVRIPVKLLERVGEPPKGLDGWGRRPDSLFTIESGGLFFVSWLQAGASSSAVLS